MNRVLFLPLLLVLPFFHGKRKSREDGETRCGRRFQEVRNGNKEEQGRYSQERGCRPHAAPLRNGLQSVQSLFPSHNIAAKLWKSVKTELEESGHRLDRWLSY